MKRLLECGRYLCQQLAIEKIKDIGQYEYANSQPAQGKTGENSLETLLPGHPPFQDCRAVGLLHGYRKIAT
jgi:hypothetical protein